MLCFPSFVSNFTVYRFIKSAFIHAVKNNTPNSLCNYFEGFPHSSAIQPLSVAVDATVIVVVIIVVVVTAAKQINI